MAPTSLQLIFKLQHHNPIPNPDHRWCDDSPRYPLFRPSCISQGSIHDHLAQRGLMYRELLRLARKSLFYSSLRKSSPCWLLFQIGCRSSFSPLCFAHSFSAVGPRIPARVRTLLGEGGVFLCRICFGHHPSSSVLAHHHLFCCVAFGVNATFGGSSLFPLFFLRFCGGVSSGVSIRYFLQQCPVMAFTIAPFTCWPGHQVHLRASCRHHHVRSLDQWLDRLFSCRLVYSAVGLSIRLLQRLFGFRLVCAF